MAGVRTSASLYARVRRRQGRRATWHDRRFQAAQSACIARHRCANLRRRRAAGRHRAVGDRIGVGLDVADARYRRRHVRARRSARSASVAAPRS